MTGCAAAVVRSGREALDYLRAYVVQLVVLDVSMPGMSELDVLREIEADAGGQATTARKGKP
jgi:CheY-like chemotaxis protein